jgi:Flp pilus assembly protein CpaB
LSKRSNLLVIIGLAVFLLGGAVVLITTRSSTSSASSGSVSVLVARQALSSGTTGDQLVAGNLVQARSLKAGEVAPGAITSTAQLSGRTLSNDVPAGQQITQGSLTGFSPAQVGGGTVAGRLDVPAGKQALALQVPFVAGGAQLVNPGTLVNIYVNVAKGGKADLPCTELALPNMQVLAASAATGATPTGATSVAASGPDIVYVLAVDPAQAQALIFYQKNEALYFTVIPKNQAPTSPAGCVGYQDLVRK